MIDILYLAHGRPEFTRASMDALRANTNWDLVSRVLIYDDGGESPDFVAQAKFPIETVYRSAAIGGPIAIMNEFLEREGLPAFAKIDNDVIVPPNWLDRCADVMETHPELDLLGIEPPVSRTPSPWSGIRVSPPEHQYAGCGYAPCDSIGGIGLMRRSAFAARAPMKPHHLYGGFTDWQLKNADVRKGWVAPPLDLFLLDRLPIDPWVSLSRKYIAAGEQRPWTNYRAEDSALWSWWDKAALAA